MLTLFVGLLFITLAVVMIACYLAYCFGRFVESYENMRERLAKLEEKPAGIKRLPNRTIEGLEDAQAVLIDIAMEHQITGLRLSQLDEVFRTLRADPFNYQYRPDGSKEKKMTPKESKL